MRVMILVTHLLGTGHLRRALTLADAFDDAGHEAVVVSGGMPVAWGRASGVAMVQLPPLRSDGTNFSRLLDENGQQAGAARMAARETALLAALEKIGPHALITELFPFGRRQLQAEFEMVLQAARCAGARIFASIRDILAPPSKPAKVTLAEDLIARFYDAVLVHADEAVAPLEASWPVGGGLRPFLHYTGFVAPPRAEPHPDKAGAGEVLVSAGGGPVGERLFLTALSAASRDGRRWRLLLGGDGAGARAAQIMRDAPPNVLAEPVRPDFRQMLHHAAASVSLCGYNTALDLLQTACPSVLVPFDAGSEVEQTLRATALARRPGIEMLRSDDVDAETLLQAVQRVTAEGRGSGDPVAFDGAARSVRIVERSVGARDAD